MSEPLSRQIAVALEYDGHGAPRVTAKGRGEIAQKIVETAREHHAADGRHACAMDFVTLERRARD